ncbi:MAG: hypothetical protein CVU55_15845 [Deltaproteobacteria bacterium HGW-Deltaproteobacteria-13]|nr:MAG: hypothetical protein CVU55_15845 [Deltaproteobacteria bacterium HGW-Deltaproteobacteria-13]
MFLSKILQVTSYGLILLYFYPPVNKNCKIISNIFYLFFTTDGFEIHPKTKSEASEVLKFFMNAGSPVSSTFPDDQKIKTMKWFE